MNSRAKGKRGELELAKVLRLYGYDAHRGQQYKGGADSPDVTGIPGFHIEVKRVERLDLDAAMEQSIRDAGTEKPLVIHRKNGKPWKVTMLLEDFIEVINSGNE
jgi:Holliday junction resolvase